MIDITINDDYAVLLFGMGLFINKVTTDLIKKSRE